MTRNLNALEEALYIRATRIRLTPPLPLRTRIKSCRMRQRGSIASFLDDSSQNLMPHHQGTQGPKPVRVCRRTTAFRTEVAGEVFCNLLGKQAAAGSLLEPRLVRIYQVRHWLCY